MSLVSRILEDTLTVLDSQVLGTCVCVYDSIIASDDDESVGLVLR